MSAWMPMLKKECRGGRIPFLIVLLVLTAAVILSFYFDSQSSVPDSAVLIAAGFMLVMVHIFYLPGYMLASLSSENKKMHLWLQSPLSGSALLGAKILSGFGYSLISLAIACLFTLYAAFFDINILQLNDNLSMSIVISTGILIVIYILLLELYIAVWSTFLWVLDRFLITRLGGLRWFLILLIPVISWLFSVIKDSWLYKICTQWGAINTDIFTSFTPYLGQYNGTVYIGVIVYHIIIASLLFGLSSWLLDNKVEVS
ncbi:hypothetical protein EV207_105106 [Scopulibacillus darangshiensis]|uniref:ABC-2 type transport system permease protein n=1 Tax=Scopulibacillus darangshiensis TaxID=442528 RepID=A0A4R2P728_9BACL|nr:hypothetical protein [Scopulibacillus darangshiensis]TCP30577.1 hypothetical protein EV207_105106 [Scopulibacillus darangshiensis]